MSLRDLWDELMQPAGREQTPAARLGTAAGHVVLGAAAGLPFAALFSAVGAAVVVLILYWALKEWRDLRAGGGWRDGVIDAGFVGLGALALSWPVLWPLALAGVVADGAYGKGWR